MRWFGFIYLYKMKLTKEGQKVYNKLKKQGYSDEEIAESFLFPMELTPEEREQSEKEFREFREKAQASISEEERKEIKKLQIKFLMEDTKVDEENLPKVSDEELSEMLLEFQKCLKDFNYWYKKYWKTNG
jgi:hypothetical protein